MYICLYCLIDKPITLTDSPFSPFPTFHTLSVFPIGSQHLYQSLYIYSILAKLHNISILRRFYIYYRCIYINQSIRVPCTVRPEITISLRCAGAHSRLESQLDTTPFVVRPSGLCHPFSMYVIKYPRIVYKYFNYFVYELVILYSWNHQINSLLYLINCVTSLGQNLQYPVLQHIDPTVYH